MHMQLERLTLPLQLPVSVADVKAHTRIDHDAEDALIETYLRAAVELAEQETRRALLCARQRITYDDYPLAGASRAALTLPVGPIRRVVSVEWTADHQTWQALTADEYRLSSGSPARIKPPARRDWTMSSEAAAVRVTVDAGEMTSFSTDPATNRITLDHWPALAAGDGVILTYSGGTLPAPLPSYRPVFIRDVIDARTYTLAATLGGDTIDITDAGTGTHYLGQPGPAGSLGILPTGVRQYILVRAADLYAERNSAIDTRGTLSPLPYVDRLLDASRIPTF